MPNDIIDLPLQGRMASLHVGSVDDAARTVEIIWSTGATVRRARLWDEAVDAALSLDPGMIRIKPIEFQSTPPSTMMRIVAIIALLDLSRIQASLVIGLAETELLGLNLV